MICLLVFFPLLTVSFFFDLFDSCMAGPYFDVGQLRFSVEFSPFPKIGSGIFLHGACVCVHVYLVRKEQNKGSDGC